jgi:hypothetical protein
MKKHSYRILGKRRQAKDILFYIEDAEDAKTIFKYAVDKKRTKELKSNFQIAETLIQQTKQGKQVNVSRFSPMVNEIRKALKELSNPQLKLI